MESSGKFLPTILVPLCLSSQGAYSSCRHLEAASKELAAWLDAIPLSGIDDLKKRLDEVDKDCKEGLPATLAAAMESGQARQEVEVRNRHYTCQQARISMILLQTNCS